MEEGLIMAKTEREKHYLEISEIDMDLQALGTT